MTTETPTIEFTKSDEYRRELSHELSLATREFHRARGDWIDLKAETADAKKEMEAAQTRVNRIADQLRDVELGQYQPSFPETSTNGHAPEQSDPDNDLNAAVGQNRKAKVDAGGMAPINALCDFGVTKRQAEMIEQSELAKEHSITTVSDFEKAIAKDEWWHRKIKGIGKSKVDGITDAIVAYRAKFPIPNPDDEEADDTPAADDTSAETADESQSFPNRNDEGESWAKCSTVNRWSREGEGWSVLVAVGFGKEAGTFHSCVMAQMGSDVIGRDTPFLESELHGSQGEAARAAVGELVESWKKTGGDRKEAALELEDWASDEWPAAEASE